MTPGVFDHQQVVYRELAETARVFFHSDWRNLPIRPRFSRFIAGPTGTGKTHMVTALGRDLGLPVFSITATSWIPFGASQRGARTTWIDLVEFCRSHTKGIIFLDEVDKLMGWSPWMQFIRTEAFALLDSRVPDTVTLTGSDTCEDDPDELKGRVETARIRLADSFLLLGAGAFQPLWQGKATGPIGFGSASQSPSELLEKADLGTVIPAEIINRFASPILLLNPLRAMDYKSILARVVSQLDTPLKGFVESIGEESIDDAVKNGTGCRWIEEVVLRALMNMPIELSPGPAAEVDRAMA
jgi:hypothetical protein